LFADRSVRVTRVTAQQVPGFAIVFKAGAFAFRVGIKAQAFGAGEDGDGYDVPDVQRDDVSDEGVDVFSV
jgi:hypothetical protein